MLPSDAVQWSKENLWPTATVHGNDNRTGLSPTSGDGLQTAALKFAANLWPTASARDWKSGEASQETLDRNSRPLNEAATDWANTWLTPLSVYGDHPGITSDQHLPGQAIAFLRSHLVALTSKDGPECLQYDPTLHRLSLNPAFVEWLMGWSDGHTMPYVQTGSGSAATG